MASIRTANLQGFNNHFAANLHLDLNQVAFKQPAPDQWTPIHNDCFNDSLFVKPIDLDLVSRHLPKCTISQFGVARADINYARPDGLFEAGRSALRQIRYRECTQRPATRPDLGA